MPKLIEIEGATTGTDFKVSEKRLKDFLNGKCKNPDGVHTFKLVPREHQNAQLLALVDSDYDFEVLTECAFILPAYEMDGNDLKLTVIPCSNPIYLEYLTSLRDKELQNMPSPVKPIIQQTTETTEESPQPPKPLPRKSLSISKNMQSHGRPAESNGHPVESNGHPEKSHGHLAEGHGHSAESHGHPAEGHEHLAEGHGHPAEGHEHLGEGHGHPAEGHEHLAESHGHPAEGHEHLAESHGHPAEGHEHLAESHGHPAESHGHPAESWGPPAESYKHPAESWGPPAESYKHPAESWGPPAESYKHPAESHGHPAESYKHSAESHGHPAEGHEHLAESHGHPAESYKHSAESHGYPAESHGYPAESHGYPAESHGHLAESWGPPAESYKQPAESHGHPAESYKHSAESHGHPAESYKHPAESHGHPAESYKHSAESHGYPAESHEYTAEGYGSPAESHGYPAESHGYPAESYKHLAESHGYPAESHGHPSESHGHPSESPGDLAETKPKQLEGDATESDKYDEQSMEDPHPGNLQGIDIYKVFIENINPKTSKECLYNFLEGRGDADVVDMDKGNIPGTAMITFSEKPDMSSLEEGCKKRPVEGNYLRVSPVEKPRSVRVSGLPHKFSSDSVEYAFLNKKRGIGVEVDSVELLPASREAIVFFHDFSDAEKACDPSTNIKVEDKRVTMKLHYPCLYSSQNIEPDPELPSSEKEKDEEACHRFEIEVENYILHFLHRSVMYYEKLKDALSEINATPSVEKQGTSVHLQVECSASLDFSTVETLVFSFIGKNKLVSHKLQLDPSLHKAVHADLSTTLENLKQKVKVYKETGYLIIVGEKTSVEMVLNEIHKIKEHLTKRVLENIELKSHQMKFLLVSKYEKCLRKDFPNLNVSFDTTLNRVTLEGIKSDNITAKLNVHSYLNKMLRKDVHFENEVIWNILKQQKTQAFLEEVLDQSGIVCCVDVQEKTQVVRVYACSDEDVAQGKELIEKSIVDMKFPVSEKSRNCLHSSGWNDLKQSLKDKHPGKIVIQVPKDEKVIAIATKDIAHDVQAEIGRYLKTKAIQQQNFPLIKPFRRYFQEYKHDDIRSFENYFHSENVKIVFDEEGLCISGSITGVKKTMDELNKIKSKICFNEFKLKQHGIKELLTKDCGKTVILLVEKKHSCVIIPETESSEHAKGLKSADINKNWLRPGGRTVRVHLGDITELKVDAIVNAANTDLDHGGGIARAIVQKGGSTIQDECRAYIDDNGSLSDGEVFTSSPGRLPCKAIIHAVGPRWQDGHHSERAVLSETVKNILQEANHNQFTSVAMPALSTGIFNYPLEAAVSVIAKALLDYWDDEEGGSVTDVWFCDVGKKTISTFVTVLDKMCGEDGEDGAEATNRNSTLSDSDDQDIDSDSDSDSDHSYSESTNSSSSNNTIEIIKGNLADQKVDVLVSPVSQNLDLSVSAVSNSLLLKAGDDLQDECHQKYPDGLDLGDICVVDGGPMLPCQKLFFGRLEKMDRKGHAKKVLDVFVTSCLKLAAKKSLTSIAFPALGSGKLGFPADISASLMYGAVKSHFQNYPSTSLQKVLFVIHPRDTAVLKAFKSQSDESDYSQSKTFKEQKPNKGHHHGYRQKPFQHHQHSSDQDKFQCGGIKVQVVKGDITKESTDCIVNSTNSNLDLKTGAVSRALLAQAGPDLEEDCEEKREHMKKTGVAMTASGDLNCKSILHIKAQTSDSGWSSILAKGLNLVDRKGITSLSIPALGTGGQKGSAEKVAKVIADTVKEFGFSHKSSSLKLIRLVIFHGYMVSAFESAFAGARRDSPGRRGYQGSRPKQPLNSSRQSMGESFVISIYAEGNHKVEAAKEDFIEQCRKMFDNKTISEMMGGRYDDLNDHQKKSVHDIASKFGVEISKSRDGLLEIFGLKEKVSDAYQKILEMVVSFKKSSEMHKDAKVLAKLVQWYYIDRNGESQPFSTGINARLEKAFNDNERTIEIKDPKGRAYKVDLKKMEEYPVHGKHVKIPIVRNDNKGSGHSQLVKGEKEAMAGNKTVYFPLQAERSHKDTAEEHHYRTAESQFLRLLGSGAAQYRVMKVEYVVNPDLIRRFRAAQQNLKKTRGEDMSHPVLAFHGTKVESIRKICEGGFLAPGDKGFMAKTDSGYYGAGVYFSEYPGYSMGYITGATTIMLCQVLLGKQYTCPSLMSGAKLQSGYDSHVSPCGKELIIFNTSFILPSYIVHYGPNSTNFQYT